jgi:membrane protein implicated in regulation of membrane protease activity
MSLLKFFVTVARGAVLTNISLSQKLQLVLSSCLSVLCLTLKKNFFAFRKSRSLPRKPVPVEAIEL